MLPSKPSPVTVGPLASSGRMRPADPGTCPPVAMFRLICMCDPTQLRIVMPLAVVPVAQMRVARTGKATPAAM